MIEVVVAHRHPVIAAGVSRALQGETDMVVSTMRVESLLGNDASSLPTGVLIVDYHDGSRLVSRHGRRRGLRCVVVTSLDRTWEVREALQAGVLGYALVTGPLSEVVDAVRCASRGARFIPPALAQQVATTVPHEDLTEREIEVLARLMRGCSNKEIAVNLDIAIGTVKCHVRSILGKLDVNSRTEAVVMAYERGILEREALMREVSRSGNPEGAEKPTRTAG